MPIMEIPREISNTINYALDNFVPPAIRDSKWFMSPMMRLALGPKYRYYMEFKESLPTLSATEIDSYYEVLSDTFIKRDTDLNRQSVSFIMKNVVGESVIDIGCGRGYLAREIAKELKTRGGSVHGFDVAATPGIRDGVTYQNGTILSLPYEDKSFDTVICSHVLEHIRDIKEALKEVRRIAAKRIIIAVPRQREYRYTFDLHIHFFPYLFDFQRLMESPAAQYYEIQRDYICIDDLD